MLDRKNIEQLLKVNGVDVSAPDEEIKSILVSARWHYDDVETALLVLRENTKSHQTHVDSMHKVFRSDEKLHPETISALLGIDQTVTVDAKRAQGSKRSKRTISSGQMMQIGLVSLCFSVLFVLASMWYLEMGVFHITMK